MKVRLTTSTTPGNHRPNTKEDILVVQGGWNDKVGKDAYRDWGDVCGSYCGLLEFTTFNNFVKCDKQILVRKGFWSGVNIHRTRNFPKADIGI